MRGFEKKLEGFLKNVKKFYKNLKENRGGQKSLVAIQKICFFLHILYHCACNYTLCGLQTTQYYLSSKVKVLCLCYVVSVFYFICVCVCVCVRLQYNTVNLPSTIPLFA